MVVPPIASCAGMTDASVDHFMQEMLFARLICIIDATVPLASRLDQPGVLSCLINKNALSSPALLQGTTKTSLHTFDNSLNLSKLSAFFMPDR